MTTRVDDLDDALAALRAGRPVVVADDADRENEGDLIFAADLATPELMAFTIRHTSGVICVPMPGARLDALGLELMARRNTDPFRTAFTVSVDARHGVTTGISAADRAMTVRLLADPRCGPADLVQPGHLFPLRAADGGVLARPGHTEAAVDLLRLAGLGEVGVIAELVNDDGTMQRGPDLRAFADRHDLRLITVGQLIEHRRRAESQQVRLVETALPTSHGVFRAVGYRDTIGGAEHLALVRGDVAGEGPVLTRVHSECLTGDAFGSLRCDCGPQLDLALGQIAAAERGVLVYLRGHEGRGIGLAAKLQAYALQDRGRDTVDANLELGLPVDARDYAAAAQILRDLGVHQVDLLTNNPAKADQLSRYGVAVTSRVPLPVHPQPHNQAYLRTKRDRLGHDLPQLGAR